MSKIRGLDAVILIVKDFEEQRRFYRDILGLDEIADYGDAVFFACGDQKLALFGRAHHAEGTKRLEGASKGISHLEFRVDHGTFEALKKKLTETGHRAYGDNFEDADGNLFHFNLDG